MMYHTCLSLESVRNAGITPGSQKMEEIASSRNAKLMRLYLSMVFASNAEIIQDHKMMLRIAGQINAQVIKGYW
jgi:hypothetical protein